MYVYGLRDCAAIMIHVILLKEWKWYSLDFQPAFSYKALLSLILTLDRKARVWNGTGKEERPLLQPVSSKLKFHMLLTPIWDGDWQPKN